MASIATPRRSGITKRLPTWHSNARSTGSTNTCEADFGKGRELKYSYSLHDKKAQNHELQSVTSMKRRLVLWAVAGLLVATSWVLLSLVIPLWSQPLLWTLAQLSCPIVLFSHFAIQWYWVILSNAPFYLVLGAMVEGFIRLARLRSESV